MITTENMNAIVRELWNAIRDESLCPKGRLVPTSAGASEEIYGAYGTQNLPWCKTLEAIVKTLYPDADVCLYSDSGHSEYIVAVKCDGNDEPRFYSPSRDDNFENFMPVENEVLIGHGIESENNMAAVVASVTTKLRETMGQKQL